MSFNRALTTEKHCVATSPKSTPWCGVQNPGLQKNPPFFGKQKIRQNFVLTLAQLSRRRSGTECGTRSWRSGRLRWTRWAGSWCGPAAPSADTSPKYTPCTGPRTRGFYFLFYLVFFINRALNSFLQQSNI